MSTDGAQKQSKNTRPLLIALIAVIVIMATSNILIGFPSKLKKAHAEPTVDDPCGISGWVFNDRNADGVFQYGEPMVGSTDVQGSEPGIPDVTVELERPNGTPVDSTTSWNGAENTGWFRFQGLAPQVYAVIETDPTGWVSVSMNRQVVPLQVSCVAEVFFGDRRENSIAGVVFEDLNGNRRQDQGEPGIPDAAVSLSSRQGSYSNSQTTDEYGAYEFNDVPAGKYVVEETDPVGYISLSPNSVNVNLKDGGFGTANFADASTSNSITGVVFADKNGNGKQDPGDNGLSQWDVTFSKVSAAGADGLDAADTTVQTNAQGQYVIPSLAAGTYQVSSAVPAGYSAVSPAIVTITAQNNQVAQANFALGNSGSVAGVVFLDQNGDGVQQWTELGMPNVEVSLSSGGSTITDTATIFNGSYSFDSLSPGGITVTVSLPVELFSTTPESQEVTLDADGAAFANFGVGEPNSVGGIVFDDSNLDGQRDITEPGIFGVTVALKNSHGITIQTQTTVGSGAYQFESVSAGTYTVVQTDLDGYASTTPNIVPVDLLSDAFTAANFGDRQVLGEFIYLPENHVGTN